MKLDLTVSAYIFNEDKLLLIYHKKLQKWLPPGGHIDENETPDAAVIREAKEEVGLEVILLNYNSLKYETVQHCAIPFHADIHNVGDHNHHGYCFLCKPKNNQIIINKDEAEDCRWVLESELDDPIYLDSVREIGKLAFKKYKELSS